MSPSGRLAILVTLCHFAAKTYQLNNHTQPEDTVIESPNYPRQYPPDLNLTWELNVSSGKWGLVVTDFDLDFGSESHDNSDWLEIRDRGGKRVRYTVHVPPLLPYISEGPRLIIQFVSDRFSDTNKRGFQLQVLYGASEREVHTKVHHATETKLEKSPEAAKTYQFNKYNKPEDTVIESPSYPRQYPPDLNQTWEFNVSFGKWGLVFTDFDLGIGSESYGNPDWLDIFDRGGKRVRYTVHVPPLLPYISEGPQLIIQFVSDRFSDTNKRGFQLQVLYGASEREVHMKIHEATKPVKSREDDASLTLVIITAGLTLVAFLIILLVVVLIRKNSQNRSENRNIFGVRRNSGISHSRRTRSVDETAPTDVPEEQPGRPERTVQRSNSQMNWMARAELTSTMQKTGSTRPNAYTCTKVVTAASATSQAAASCLTSSNNHMTRSCESLNEYSETVDSLNCTPGTSRTNHAVDNDSEQPPSYEESRLIPETYQNNEQLQPGLSDCYENLTPNVCKTRQHLGTETSIYINTARNSGSRGSINEITIDANSCTIKATRGETPDDRLSISKSAINMDGPTTNIVIYQNVSVNKQPERETNQPSSSSIQIIDGYAFIVPSSDHVSSYNLLSQHAIVDNLREARPLGNSYMTQHATHDDAEVGPEQSSTGACRDIYINTRETDMKVNDM